jgi:hypothetical protein
MVEVLFDGFIDVIKSVTITLVPLILIFFVMQFIFLKIPMRKLVKILKGFVLTFIGLVLLLHGINIGFVNIGSIFGEKLMLLESNWIIIPIGFVLGLIVTLAEPTVQILNDQIEKATSGYINKKLVLYSLAIGVALSMVLSMIRIFTNLPLIYIVLPGYTLALILTRFTNSLFVEIAFDSGGVVSGPMISSFLLAFMIGSSSAIDGNNPLVDGLGMISIVSLVPIITVLILGILYERKSRRLRR